MFNSQVKPLPFAFRLPVFWQRRRATPDIRQPGEDEAADLLRLAETSPHLLHDIGFRQESDGTWTDGTRRIGPQRRSDVDRLLGGMQFSGRL